MFIKTLTIENFRGFEKKPFTFEPTLDTVPHLRGRTYIGGEIGDGKTSTREAIKWLLTGRAIGLDAGGSGVREKIVRREAGPTAQVIVSADLTVGERAVRLVRQWDGTRTTLSIDNVTSDSLKDAQAALETLLGFKDTDQVDRVIGSCLDSRTFTDLKHADARAVLMDILHVRIVFNGETFTVEQLDAKYDGWVDVRKSLKRRLQSTIVPPEPEYAPPNLDDLIVKLAAVKLEADAVKTSIAEKHGAQQPLEDALLLLETEAKSIGKALDDSVGALAESDRITERLKALGDQLANLPADPRTEVATLQARLRTLEETIPHCVAHDPAKGCVLDTSIPCLTAGDHFIEKGKTLEKERLKTLKVVDRRIHEAETVKSLTDERNRLESRSGNVQRIIADRATLGLRADTIENERESLTVRLGQAEDISAELEKAAALGERIKRGEETIAQVKRLIDAQTLHDTKKAEKTALIAELETAEKQCEIFGPKGLRVKALEMALGMFTTQVNGFLEPYGWTLSFQLEPWEVLVNGRPYETYSDAQQLIIGAGLQLAVASLTNFNLAVIDSVDRLDGKRRPMFTEMVVLSPLDQVIVLATRDKDKPLPNVAGVQAVRL